MRRSALRNIITASFMLIVLLIFSTELSGTTFRRLFTTVPVSEVKPSPEPSLTLAPTYAPSSSPSPSPSHSPEPSPSPSPSPTPEPEPEPTVTPFPESNDYTPSTDASLCQVIYHGDRSRNEIALTFDDQGPLMENILNILDSRDIKATFFLMSRELERDPLLWQNAIENGHHVLNHTVKHNTNLYKQSTEYIYKEITGWETVAAHVLGQEYLGMMKSEFPIFRTPGGGRSDRLHRILGDLGYPVAAYWTCEDVYFSKHNPNKISLPEHYVREAKNGAIFLMHPYCYVYLEEVIDKVIAKGYTFSLLADIIEFPVMD